MLLIHFLRLTESAPHLVLKSRFNEPYYRDIFVNNVNKHNNFNSFKDSFIYDSSQTLFVYKHVVEPLFNYYFSNVNTYYSVVDKNQPNLSLFKSNNHIDCENFVDKAFKDKATYVAQNIKIVKRLKDETQHPLYDETYADISWQDTFNGVRRALRFLDSPQSIVCEYTRWVGMPSDWLLKLLPLNIRIVLPFFKKLKLKIHHNIDTLPPAWRYFIDIEILAGYPKQAWRQFTDDPKLWLSTPSKTQYTKEWWCNQFSSTFAANAQHCAGTLLTLEQFTLSPWLWVTSGATKYSKLTMDGEIVKTKLGAAVSNSDNELLHYVFDINDNHLKDFSKIGVFIKPDEKGYKRRLIANLPLGGYIIAAYIRYLITSYVTDTPRFMNLSPTPQDMVDVTQLLRAGHLAMPLDESAYDYNVTTESWEGFIMFLESYFPFNKGVQLFKNYFKHAIWEFDGKQGIWNSGMPSGLALTSFVNSWMNYIKQMQLEPGHINWAAGDDVLSFPYNEKLSLHYLEKEYAKFGSVAHALKNWKSHRYAEYLKRIYYKNGTSGYPTRIFSSLIWAGTERFFLPSDRLPELAELFKQFFDRIGRLMPENYVAADLSRAISSKVPGFNIEVAKQWLHSPRIHGGFGCIPYNNKAFTWIVENKYEKTVKNNRIRLPRPIIYSGKVSLSVGTYTLNQSDFRLGPPLHLLPINSWEEWERRLNREDIDYHGPLQSLVMDVIPLPTIPFVSTAILSSIAQELGYNCYPNMRGRLNSITSRLVKASLFLAETMYQRMRTSKLVTWV